jgi:excisionase family DNA binding protein
LKEIKIKNYEELPVMLNANNLCEVLGISRSKAYSLMKEKRFPVLQIGNKLLTPRDKFIDWIEKNTQQ